MSRPALVIPLLVLLSGCRPVQDRAGGASSTARKVGPGLERLLSRMRDAGLPSGEREKYWRSVQGTLVSATGKVEAVSIEILLLCPLNGGHGGEAYVRATPTAEHAGALSSLQPGQPLTLLGELSGERPTAEKYGTKESPVVLHNARIRIR
jgi:hypothetical protein